MLNKVWFRTGIMLIILFVLIKLIMEVHVIFNPIIIIVKSVLLPFILSGFLFYVFLPLQKLLEKYRIPRWGSITIIFVILIGIITAAVTVVAPLIMNQINNLIKQAPQLQQETQAMIKYALDQMDKLPNDVTDRVNKVVKSFGDNVTNVLTNSISIVSQIISTLFLLIMVPFFLIYMLKDHEKFIPSIAKLFNGDRKVFVVNLLKDLK